MKPIDGNIKLVEYNHSYAAAVAEMWAHSSDGWEGYDFNATEESVKQDVDNSSYLNVYLALDGEKVVGYCSLSEYREDEGALYIDLLNVRPDYHGRKIGKALVLMAVERTVELGWSRLDLYTWPGNTKATPLYKKCGFFWEERDDATHLMNFIPTVLNTELLQDYFADIDWYKDNTRVIEVVPDGRRENGFDYFTYEWKSRNKNLSVEFCRRGRGMRKIETDKYKITVTVEKLNLVIGRSYNIKYDIINKTDRPLNISIKGINDKNIIFNFDKEYTVNEKTSITAEFSVEKIEQEQSIWKTHPGVVSEIIINGKKVMFKVGVIPEFPARISLKNPCKICYAGIQSEFHINVENNFDQPATFSFELPENEALMPQKKQFSISMKSKEKKSLSVPYILKKCCVYAQKLQVTATPDKGREMVFERRIGASFHEHSGIFYGETERYFQIGNGRYFIKLVHTEFGHEFLNRIIIGDITKKFLFWVLPPRIGKPFSDEFRKHKFSTATFSQDGNSVTLRVSFISENSKGVEFDILYRLDPDGIVEYWYEIGHVDDCDTNTDLWIGNELHAEFHNPIVPYGGKFIECRGDLENKHSFWEPSLFSENWIYNREMNHDSSYGVCWPDEYELAIMMGMFLSCKMENSDSGTIAKSKPVRLAVGTFDDWHRFREFVLKRELKRQQLTESFEFRINTGNPFVDENFPISIIEHRQKYFDGKISISSENSLVNNFSIKYSADQKIKICNVDTQPFPIERKNTIDIVRLQAKSGGSEIDRKKVIFPVGSDKITTEKRQTGDNEVFYLDNGIISLKASPLFAPGLFSCIFDNKEWLDSSFPQSGSRSWWNPWPGGLLCFPQTMSLKSVLKENCTVEFAEKEDQLGNKWNGLRIDVDIKKHEILRGLSWKQYFLVLPGVPVLLYLTEIIQKTGEFIDDLIFETNFFPLTYEQLGHGYWMFKNSEGQSCRLYAGAEQMQMLTNSSVAFGGRERSTQVQFYIDRDKTSTGIGVNKDLMYAWWEDKIICPHNDRFVLPAKFLIFDERELPDEWLSDLKNILPL